jgi:hypothetical protein
LTIRSARFTLPSMPRTSLVVPVGEASAYYTGAPGVPGHVSILFPFADASDIDEAALEELLSRFSTFDFVLDRIEQFEDGTRWLRPVPSAPFVDLTAAIWQRWPDFPPYEGAFDEPIPHVTITVEDVPVPIACRATEVLLLEEADDGSWTTIRTFPLQGVA